jgi:hypothetical protein
MKPGTILKMLDGCRVWPDTFSQNLSFNLPPGEIILVLEKRMDNCYKIMTQFGIGFVHRMWLEHNRSAEIIT